MPRDITQTAAQIPDLTDAETEAARQLTICNACRYCEGYCAVFPAMTRHRDFASGDLSHLANLCHNCRGCYYSCQYSPPHDFALNLPAALAEVRQESWEQNIRPAAFARAFSSHGVAIAVLGALLIAVFAWLALSAGGAGGAESGGNFYSYISHATMVAIFLPLFVLPLAEIWLALRRYWRQTGGGPIRRADLRGAMAAALRLKNLKGGQGEGCNFERGDRFSNARRHAHHAVFWGFLLCFGATVSATVMDYAFGWPAPYPLLSLPKILGISGGLLLLAGTLAMGWLKTRADPALAARRLWGGEMAFIVLLGLTALTGLTLYAATGSGLVGILLSLHLGCVATLFLMMPYSKMVHGFFRTAALIVEEQKRTA